MASILSLGERENLEKVVERRSFDSCWKQCFFFVCVNLGASFQVSYENVVI